jgi:hypothetical protein
MLASRQKSTKQNPPSAKVRSRSCAGSSRDAVAFRKAAPGRNSGSHQEIGNAQPINLAAGSSGHSLDAATRTSMESQLGHDLSGVRLHTGVEAAAAAKALHARAFTVSQDIYFGANSFSPGSADGNRLLMHELVHTVQQASGSSASPMTKLDVSHPGDPAEVEADRITDLLSGGASAGITSPLPITAARKTISRAPLVTNGGSFDVSNYDENDTDVGKDSDKKVGAKIDITFTPAETVTSDKISFVQIMKTVKDGKAYLFENEKARATETHWWNFWNSDSDRGWAVDRLAGKKSPIYAQQDDGTEGGNTIFGNRKSKTDFKAAWMHDSISLSRAKGKVMYSDAKAYALDATNGKYLGGISWGFDTDSAGKTTKKTEAVYEMGSPTGIQVKALERWNEQADLKDTDAKKNAPGQEKVPVP